MPIRHDTGVEALEPKAPVLTWVNHASFLLRSGSVRLLCDPWLSGSAFNRGWRLISESAFQPEDFAGVTHIWFSHQHPDHFSPPDLRRIPPEIRKKIIVLYHRTIDKKVVRFCKSLGFKDEVEMRDRRWVDLGEGISVSCEAWYDTDSWLAIKTPGGTILNLNDCVVDSPRLARRIAKAVGPVRVLMTQFSYAEYCGNREDAASRVNSAQEKLRRIQVQAQTFAPEVIVPFASFIYWSHPENFYMNEQTNRIQTVAAFVESSLGSKAVVLYPGEHWHLGAAHDWRPAAKRYSADLETKLARGPAETAQTVPRDTLIAAAERFVQRLNHNNPLLRFLPVKPVTIALSDLEIGIVLSRCGASACAWPSRPDIIMHSESLLFCLKFPWGANALHVNARFTSVDGGHRKFFALFRPADWADHGYTLEFKRLPVLLRAAAFRAGIALHKRMEQRRRASC